MGQLVLEPYLDKASAFALLLQVQGKAGMVGEANILRVAATATRFAYLPISMPSPATGAARNFPSAAAQISNYLPLDCLLKGFIASHTQVYLK